MSTITTSTPLARFETWLKDKDPAEVGRLLKEYVAESNHNSWDGYDRRDLTGIRRMFLDVMVYYEHADPDQFRRITSVNPL